MTTMAGVNGPIADARFDKMGLLLTTALVPSAN